MMKFPNEIALFQKYSKYKYLDENWNFVAGFAEVSNAKIIGSILRTIYSWMIRE